MNNNTRTIRSEEITIDFQLYCTGRFKKIPRFFLFGTSCSAVERFDLSGA